VRTSLFIAPDERLIEQAKLTGTDRIELYTEDFAKRFLLDKESGIAPYIRASMKAKDLGLGINAGHDLNLSNLKYFVRHIPGLMEVSIGHALISDALYFGLENTVQMYLGEIKKAKQELP
jgi:pyridoxine 5-phosphate synthase